MEMLVVISIITMLISFTLPSLSKSKERGRMAKELSAARQLAVAYDGFGIDRNGRLMAGYADEPGARGPGIPVNWPVNARYPWRLAQYLGFAVQGAILVNEQEALMKDSHTDSGAYMISVNPSLGMNMYNVGGDLTVSLPKVYVTQAEQVVQPSKLIVFGSARYNIGGQTPGFFRIESPRYSPNNPAGWTATYSESDSAHLFGFVHPRWDRQAVFSHMDTHAELLNTTEMRDMTRWNNEAAKKKDPNWRP
jgi:type II secretory pathway pseudopilin PulG